MSDGFFKLSEIQSERPDFTIPRCGLCGLYRQCRSPKMEPYGRGAKEILIVGEAPGRQEDEQGRPFIGKSGKLLRETLSNFGISMDRDTIVTNSLICRPAVVNGRIQNPEPKQIRWCRPNLVKTLATVQPKIVITLGVAALRAVVSEFWKGDIGKMERWVGWRIPTSKFWLCPTYHPSYVLRQEKNRILSQVWADHIRRAVSIKKDVPEIPDYESQVEVLTDEDEIVTAIDWFIAAGGWQAFDYEANCLKPEYPKAKLVSCSISNGERTIAYPWWGRAIAATKRYVQSKRVRKVAANIKNEDRWTRRKLKCSIVNPDHCTIIAAHVIDYRPHITSLKFQAFINLGVSTYNRNVEPYLKARKGSHYNRIHEVALPTLLTYNGLDSLFEYHLAMRQRKILGYD